MSKETMPAADAAHYELAFHVLPTVAEGEVTDVFTSLKTVIEKAGGTITLEEAPARFELAYEIIKLLEGRNRKFTSAYFGWVRFTLEPAQLEEVTEAVEGTNQLLRHLLIRLTKAEEANPFMFHEALDTPEEDDSDADEEEKTEDTEEEKAADTEKEAEKA
jgi:ribosomal protein S6